MKPYSELTREELLELKAQLKQQYKEYLKRKLTLNMARGKPGQDQLNLSMGTGWAKTGSGCGFCQNHDIRADGL